MARQKFIHLRVHSAFSLLEGAIPIPDLIQRCREDNSPAVALTDTMNLFGAMTFSQHAKDKGIQPILGAQLAVSPLQDDPRFHDSTTYGFDQINVYAKNETGYQNLLKLISLGWQKVRKMGSAYIHWDELEACHDGLIALSGANDGAISRHLQLNNTTFAEQYLEKIQNVFQDRLYVEVSRFGLDSERIEPQLVQLADVHKIPIVATNEAFFLDKSKAEAHDALLCIAEGTYVSEDNRRRLTEHHRFKSPKDMTNLFADLPDAIENTLEIAKRCAYLQPTRAPLLPSYPSQISEQEELRNQAYEGLLRRLEKQVYGAEDTDTQKQDLRQKYETRLAHELHIIEKMGFPGYFLIVSDFIKWAKTQNIPVGPGRGSGAGSLVAWSLLITDIDPIPFNLLFERFLNPERVSMPDFDVDFCQERRDEVISYVSQKYGQDRVAQIITFGKLQARAVLRDVGRVQQMPYGQVDRICKLVPNNPANPMTLDQAIEAEPELRRQMKSDPTVARLIEIGRALEGLYRHASTHAAGVVIADRPLNELTPLYYDDKSDMPVTQFNMKDVEKAGLVKFDFLGLKTLTVIAHAINYIKKSGETLDISNIPLDDLRTFQSLNRIETVGVFQLESAGMGDVLRRMKPSRFEDIIALVALYRPGPMDDIPRYCACKNGEEPVHYMHPKLEPILKETYGVMVYQEQVMQIAQVLAGYTLGQADLLRRAMGKKIKKEMDNQREKFIEGANTTSQIPPKLANQIFDQIAKFAGYGFNKCHSAPYALIAYQTAYLKANYPVEFMAASMSLDMHNTDKLNVYRQELNRLNIPLLPPSINNSFSYFESEETQGYKGIRYALAALKNVGASAIDAITLERTKNGSFKTIWDFISRIEPKYLNKRLMEGLITAGAFDELGMHRAYLMHYLEKILDYGHTVASAKKAKQGFLFGNSDASPPLPVEQRGDVRPWSPLEQLNYEFLAVGFYLTSHPLESYEGLLQRFHLKKAEELESYFTQQDTSDIKMAGIILGKKEKTSKKGSKFAFIQLSDPTGSFEVTVFSEALSRCRTIIEPGSAVLLNVNGRKDNETLRLLAQDIQSLDSLLGNHAYHYAIKVTETSAIGHLARVLKDLEPGKCTIDIIVSDGLRDITIRLPQKVKFSMESQNELQNIENITVDTFGSL